ncbi:MAG: hypothetical protein ACI9HK_006178 [Pirellulaceae bacterium]|jgi:hypothetical protein
MESAHVLSIRNRKFVETVWSNSYCAGCSDQQCEDSAGNASALRTIFQTPRELVFGAKRRGRREAEDRREEGKKEDYLGTRLMPSFQWVANYNSIAFPLDEIDKVGDVLLVEFFF